MERATFAGLKFKEFRAELFGRIGIMRFYDSWEWNVAMNLAKGRIKEFIEALEKFGGSAGNKALRQALHWDDEDFYWKVQGHLIKEGRSFIRGPACGSPLDTQGRSRMREFRSYGSVRGALRDERPYRDHSISSNENPESAKCRLSAATSSGEPSKRAYQEGEVGVSVLDMTCL
jgi:hypothetical protein